MAAKKTANKTAHLFTIKVTRSKVLITATNPDSVLSKLLLDQIKNGLTESRHPGTAAAVAIAALHDHLTR